MTEWMGKRCGFVGTQCRCVLVEGHDIPHRCAHMRDPDHIYSVEAMYDPEVYLAERHAHDLDR